MNLKAGASKQGLCKLIAYINVHRFRKVDGLSGGFHFLWGCPETCHWKQIRHGLATAKEDRQLECCCLCINKVLQHYAIEIVRMPM